MAEIVQSHRLQKERVDMDVHLIDETYELFRHFFAVPKVPYGK